MFNFDIFFQICKYLNNKDKIRLTAISTITDYYKYKLPFGDCVFQKHINRLPFFDNFEYVRCNCVNMRFPKNSKYVFMECNYDCTSDDIVKRIVFPNITHLTLCQRPNDQFYKGRRLSNICYVFSALTIPNTVTHLYFTGTFNSYLPKIPDSVTHLKFGDSFNRSTEDVIPNSVTHLRLGESFDYFHNNIPSSVTHLSVAYNFNKMHTLPHTITYIKIGKYEQYVSIDKYIT
uniref:F-box domain-containing protein n=1 Tax=viral metagenome TaxID=1070528 RepID=A0A6C0C9M5_9ZZZZ